MYIRLLGTFKIKAVVFIVINKVLNIMNIFVDSLFGFLALKYSIHNRFFANFSI